jgi:hypothetical protein
VIELRRDELVFTFPEVHPQAALHIDFQRTLRIPDDGDDYPLPPGLGRFPLRHVDDHHQNLPELWLQHGGVMLPMYQSEAMWLYFHAGHVDLQGTYPFAIKIATGKQNAVSGKPWSEDLHRRPQDYVVAPEQPWLDGYCIEKGVIRQFVAMPLGAGYTAEEQITGEAEHGGLQIMVYPMKREVFESRFPVREELARYGGVRYCIPCLASADATGAMGLAPGGRMRQEIYDDPFKLSDWDTAHTSRCFVHIANSMVWRAITGQHPPTVPPTAREYSRRGLPWFDYYNDSGAPVGGSKILKGLKSVATLGKQKGGVPLPENQSTETKNIVKLRKGLEPGQVREGRF